MRRPLYKYLASHRPKGPIVFGGPTLSTIDRTLWPEIQFAQPASAGSIVTAVQEGYSAIGLVDGFLETTRSVWHKEIIWAIEQGCLVFGAASIGALRAVELKSFGMIGVGGVYRLFDTRYLEDDDEVVIQHGPAECGYVPLTHAMVNVRFAMARATNSGVLHRHLALIVIDAAKSLNFRDRTVSAIHDELTRRHGPLREHAADIRHYILDPASDLKRRDALQLLDHLTMTCRPPSAEEHAPPIRELRPMIHKLNYTDQFRALLAEMAIPHENNDDEEE